MAYGAGSQIYIGWGPETTPGVAYGGTPTYIPVDPDNVNFNFDPARQALKLGMGTIFNDFTSVELAAKGTGSVQFPLWGTLGQSLLAQCGLGNGPITLPGYTTIFVGRVNSLQVYSGCRAKSIEITASNSKPWMVKIDFDFISRPTDRVLGIVPVFVTEKPFVWGDTIPAQLPGTVNAQDLDNIKMTINYNQVPFYGNHGNNLPSQLIPTDVEVMVSFTKLFDSSADYNLFNAACMLPANIFFGANGLCAGATNTVAFTMPHSVYTKQTFKNPLKGAITEDYDAVGLATTGASPLIYAVTA